MSTRTDHPPPAGPETLDLRVPDPTDCSPQRPGSLSADERALLMLGDEGPAREAD